MIKPKELSRAEKQQLLKEVAEFIPDLKSMRVRMPALTAAAERFLLRRIKKGDERAKIYFIRSNQGLVAKVAWRCFNKEGHNFKFLDLMQVGNIGLLKAIEKFTLGRNSKFSTYATWWIRQEINRAVNNQGLLIRVPDNKASDMRTFLYRCKTDGKEINTKSLSRLDKLALAALLPSLSLSASKDEANPGVSLERVFADDKRQSPRANLERQDQDKVTEMLLARLPKRERLIIEGRFGLNGHDKCLTLRQMQSIIGITREGVRQAQNRALAHLRRLAEELGLSLESVGF